MYIITLNTAKFEYDIHSLVKAFYPEETVKVITPGTDAWKAEGYRAQAAWQGSIALGKQEIRVTLPLNRSSRNIQEKEKAVLTREAVIPDGTVYLGAEYKDLLKSLLYRSLCDVTGKTLPWGNLIGIRPTKIAM